MNDPDSIAAVTMCHHDGHSASSESERQESLFPFGVVWIVVGIRERILENRGCILKAYAVLL